MSLRTTIVPVAPYRLDLTAQALHRVTNNIVDVLAPACDLRGLKPPRYSNLWEGLCNGIIFKQLSIAAVSTIMRRLVDRFSEPLEHEGVPLVSLGVSQKVTYLKNAWSAANILLRGFGRLDVFPMGNTGVAQNIKHLSGDPQINLEEVLLEPGDMRGMLYFHLLFGKLRGHASFSAAAGSSA